MTNVTPLRRGDTPSLPPGVDPFTDMGNAHRLVLAHGQDLRHCPELGWLVWDGDLWRQDERRAHRLMMDVAADLQRAAARRLGEAKTKDEQDRAEADLKHARRSQQEPGIRRALELARHLEPVATTPGVFDQQPMLLCTANGTVDLQTGELLPHRREDLLTQTTGTAYEHDAPAPAWERFLEEIIPVVDERAFIQRFAGYSATGSTKEQCLAIPWGGGSNGKSAFLEALRFALGDYALEAEAETFMTARGGRSAENKMARLRGARLVTTSETGEGRRLDEPLIKRVTGGDPVTGHFLYREVFTFYPQFKLWMATNHKPEIRGTDHGVWRRLRLVPFTVTVPPEKQDADLPAKLRCEAEGILAWVIAGALDWAQGGLRAPDSVLAATEEWRAEANDVASFIGERCVTHVPGARVKAGVLYAEYRSWAGEQGAEVLNKTAFGRRVTDLGYPTDNSRKWRLGIGLQAEGRDD